MRSQGKGNAACWDCRFYAIINHRGNCTVAFLPIVIEKMPMKCDKREKVKK